MKLETEADFQVYADKLTSDGDPRGELVSIQLRLEKQPEDGKLKAREVELLKAHERDWLGELPELDLSVTWRRGFIDTAHLGPPIDKYVSREFDGRRAITALLQLPTAELLRKLSATPSGVEGASFEGCLEAIAQNPVPESLEHLELDRGAYWDISQTYLGGLHVAYPNLQKLRSLRIEIGSLNLRNLSLPGLRALEIVTSGLTEENVRDITDAPWPQLERLVLYVGQTDNDYGCDVTLDDLRPALAGEKFGRVRHLGLANTSFADELVEALASSRILPQLEQLDLSHGTLGEAGARALISNATAFKHLTHLDLSHSSVPASLFDELRRIGPTVELSEQHEGQRYVSVGE